MDGGIRTNFNKIIMNCQDCKFLSSQDDGYSNWTVTNTVVSCLKGKFKDIEDSYTWEEKKFYDQFNNCEHFKEGCGPTFDVDGEITIEDYKDDEEVYQLLVKHKND
jgi:hypothetical protein